MINSSKKIIGILIGIIIILLGIIGYLLFFNVSNNQKNNNKSEVQIINDEHAIEKLADKIRFRKNYDLIENLPEGDTKDFADWQKIALGMMSLDRSMIFPDYSSDDGLIGADTFLMYAKTLFGKDLTYKDDNYDEFKNLVYNYYYNFSYNENSKQYTVKDLYKNNFDYGDQNRDSYTMLAYIPYKLEKKNDEYYLYIYRTYKELIINGTTTRIDYFSNRNKDEVIYTMPSNVIQTAKKFNDDFIKNAKLNNLVKLKYTFKKEDINYIWIKYEILN